MRAFFIAYIILINLLGLILMGADKQKAKKNKWRIPERVLFTVAVLFGSIGILSGMYLFRHKTRKPRFSVGIPIILAIQLALVSLLFLWNRQRITSPAQTVQYELDRIEALDEQTITSFISYDSLMNSHLSSGSIDSNTAEAVNAFFRNFSYNIQNVTVTGKEAVVTVQISNIDMHALAHDLCAEILKQSAVIFPDETETAASDYYRLLGDTILNNSYSIVVTSAHFHLTEDEQGWKILSDAALEDELVSGFISYINDPCILSAEEVLTIYLDALKALNADQWIEYLEVNDIFSTYNTEYYSLIDEEYVRQLSDAFDYEILACTENGSSAEAVIRVTSLDMPGVLSAYRESLLSYASSTQSVRDDSVTFSNETAGMLLSALRENEDTLSTDVTQTLSNNGSIWEVYFDSEFVNALMGDMETAVEILYG